VIAEPYGEKIAAAILPRGPQTTNQAWPCAPAQTREAVKVTQIFHRQHLPNIAFAIGRDVVGYLGLKQVRQQPANGCCPSPFLHGKIELQIILA
jgi:hypothetical protein